MRAESIVISLKSFWAEDRRFVIPFISHTDFQTDFTSENFDQFVRNNQFKVRQKFANSVNIKIKNLCKKFIPEIVTLVVNAELLNSNFHKFRKWKVTY